jgi:hypothetical protein
MSGHNRRFFITALCAIACAATTGCLLSHSNHSVIRQDEPLSPLVFETENARNMFESHVSERQSKDEATTSFAIPFLVGLEKSVNTAENAIRNDVANLIDTNGDRIISEHEVNFHRRANKVDR